jgi:hypothetical protein
MVCPGGLWDPGAVVFGPPAIEQISEAGHEAGTAS